MRSARILTVALTLLSCGAVAGEATVSTAASQPAQAWTETKWPFLIDQWGLGRSFECKAAACGSDLTLYLRAKVGFCNCTTGIVEDDEIDRVGDVSLIGRQTSAQRFGVPVAIGWMKGRSRSFMVAALDRSQRYVLTVAVSNKCDAVVATVVADRVLSPDAERAALDFLGSEPVLQWASSTTGL